MSHAHPESTLFRRIVFCTDFSPNADFAFDFALDSARRRPGAILYLLHVIPEPDAQFWRTYLTEVDDQEGNEQRVINEKISSAYLPRVPPEVNLKIEIRRGKDDQTILEFARQVDADLIIMGRQGHGGLGKVLFGNVTEVVARKADCAVLIIPLSFRQKAEGAAAPDAHD
jgi:nucleotide-binding universal stress UspA family protein